MKTVNLASSKGTLKDFKSDVLNDYYIAAISRQVSILGRKEVLSGKGKFGIFGDGKELAQIAMAKVFKNGGLQIGILSRSDLYDVYWWIKARTHIC